MPEDEPEFPPAPCCRPHGNEADFWCGCPPAERALRAWKDGRVMPPMTPEQREWCLREIAAVEGYDRRRHEAEPDAELARTVLYAWADYCHDQGLL